MIISKYVVMLMNDDVNDGDVDDDHGDGDNEKNVIDAYVHSICNYPSVHFAGPSLKLGKLMTITLLLLAPSCLCALKPNSIEFLRLI